MSLHLNPHFSQHIGSIAELVGTPPVPGATLVGPISGLGARLLQWAGAGISGQLYILMSGLPPQSDLSRSDQLGLRLGIYLPNEKRITRDCLLGIAEHDNLKSHQLLKKYAALGRRPFVLADANAIQDGLHFAELIRPLTDTLFLLGQEQYPTRAQAIYQQWQRTRT